MRGGRGEEGEEEEEEEDEEEEEEEEEEESEMCRQTYSHRGPQQRHHCPQERLLC